jgi:hypothetical protein
MSFSHWMSFARMISFQPLSGSQNIGGLVSASLLCAVQSFLFSRYSGRWAISATLPARLLRVSLSLFGMRNSSYRMRL